MASRKKLAFALQNVLTSIDLDAPVEPDPPKKNASPEATKPQIESSANAPQHIRDIIGDLSLDLD